MNNEKKFIKLTPFKMQVLQTFPFIDADFDAITNYELLCKVVEYLNITVDNVNLLESDFKVLYDYVHDYFDNLDVQEEINNKLDQMAKDGTLQEIISDYLDMKAIFAFDNVNDMKLATNLKNGSFAKVLGYYEKNDGGIATYKIRTITNEDIIDESLIIALNNETLIAELIYNEINPMNFGCYGDGVHNDTIKLQNALNYAKNNNKLFKSTPNKTYLITQPIEIGDVTSFWNKSIIKTLDNITMITHNSTNENKHICDGLIIDCNNTNSNALECINSHGFNLNNLIIKNLNKIGLIVDSGSYEFDVNNTIIYGTGTDNDSIGILYKTSDCTFNNIIMKDVHIAIDNRGGGRFTGNNIHPWILNTIIEPNSIAYRSQSNSSFNLSQCQSDSYHYPFYVADNTGPVMQINNFNAYWQTFVQTEDVIGENIPVVFYGSNSASYSKASISNLRVSGLIWNAGKAKLSNRDDFCAQITGSTTTNIDNDIALTSLTNIYNDIVPSVNKLTKSGNTISLLLKLTIPSANTGNIILGNIPYFFRDGSEQYQDTISLLNESGNVFKTVPLTIATNGNVNIYLNENITSPFTIILNLQHQIIKQQI